MPKVRMKTTSADADRVLSPGQVINVSKEEARDLIDGGFAEPASADAPEASEKATGRRGQSRTISGEESA